MQIIDGLTHFTDVEYLKLSIANSMGLDKLLWKDRLEWVNDNQNILYDKVSEADEPYQYYKALKALDDVNNLNPTGFAVGMDSTASGVQMFACLSGCIQTAEAVNLTGDGLRHDLYSDVMNSLNIDAPRSDVKQAVMTFFYSSEAMPKAVFGSKVNKFYAAMEAKLPGACDVMKHLKLCQKFISEQYVIPKPTGGNCYITSKVMVDHKIECSLENPKLGNDWHFTQRMSEVVWNPKDKSIPANVAHTCDSWFAGEIVKICKKTYSFDVYHVHDRFFCSPKYMNRLRWVARNILANLADSNHLDKVIKTISNVPDFSYKKHSNNLSKYILNSDYFLS